MSRRLIAMVPLRTLPKTIEAAYYNRVRLALLRIGNPLRVGLPGLRGLEAIVDSDTWTVVDSLRTDNPVLAWCDFEVASRQALHEPVQCRLNLYHNQAGLIMGTALEALQLELKKRLAPSEQVTPQNDED